MANIPFTLVVVHSIPQQACNFLHLKHRLHSPLEKGLIERVIMQYFKDRTESFDDYSHCIAKNNNCDLSHIYNWMK